MARIIVIGDGPGGLSAALFLAKNQHHVDVYGKDETAMNHAYLHNYLGIDEISGTDFQTKAKKQTADFGAHLHDIEVEKVTVDDDTVKAVTVEGASIEADYLVLSEGKKADLALSLDLATSEGGAIEVDSEGRSSNDRVYVVGRSARPSRSQAIISAGDGAKCALDILSREAGKDVQDWDSPSKD